MTATDPTTTTDATGAPDPVGLLICPDGACGQAFPFTQEGAGAYVAHWAESHSPAASIHLTHLKPVLTGTATVTKADGTTYTVPLEGVT